MIKVALVLAGDNVPINIPRLGKKLNRIVKNMYFKKEVSIPIHKLGDPEKNGIWYCTDVFYKLLNEEQYTKYDYVVGITNVRITTREEYPEDLEKDYFSDLDYRRTGIITINDEMLRYNSDSKDIYQYIAFGIVEIIIGNMIKQDLHHDRLEYCIYHDCSDRNTFARMIDNSTICTNCLSIIKHIVSIELINDANKLLKWCRCYSGSQSPIKLTLRNPFVSFVCGTSIGWIVKAMLPSDEKWAQYSAIAVTILTPVFSLAYYTIRNFARSAKSSL